VARETGRRQSRRRKALSIGFGVAVLATLVAVILKNRDEFLTAMDRAPVWVLVVATALQLVALLARTEAWHVSIGAAGGTVARRALYRSAGFGYLGSQLNAQAGTAARIAVLRKAHPEHAPRVGALIAAEAPILVVEAGFGALAFWTLVGPLDLPWWVPIGVLLAVGLVSFALNRLSRNQGDTWRTGLAVLSQRRAGTLTTAVMAIAIGAQILRNWLMLGAVGLDASVFEATAVLIAIAVVAQLPIGPSIGPASVMLILGREGLAPAAAAGVLLTATGAAGAVLYVAWASLDAAAVRRNGGGRETVAPPAEQGEEHAEEQQPDRAERLGEPVRPAAGVGQR
jgi:uncharacterized membrane protein YbhN (UPF0104 family)